MRMLQVSGPPDLSPTETRLYAILAEDAGAAVPADVVQVRLWGAATPAAAAYLALYLRTLGAKLATQPDGVRLVRLPRGRGYALRPRRRGATGRLPTGPVSRPATRGLRA
jgi:DNA-binding response OmpR family regulator